jgi:chemotaxis protein CheC
MTSANDLVLDEMEIDALTELVNIGVSRAAVSLRELVGEQVILSVPSVTIRSRAQAADLLTERKSDLLVAVYQAFTGSFAGRAMLIFPETNSLELVRAVAGRHLSLEDIVELEQEALAEIGNNLTMSLPEIVRCSGAALFELPTSNADDIVLFIRINFSFKGREISGYVAMVMDLLSLTSLKSLVDEFVRRTTL